MNALGCFMWNLEDLQADLPEHPVISEVTNLPDALSEKRELLTRVGDDVFILQDYGDGHYVLSRAVAQRGGWAYLYDTIDPEDEPELYAQVETLFEIAIMEIVL